MKMNFPRIEISGAKTDAYDSSRRSGGTGTSKKIRRLIRDEEVHIWAMAEFPF